MSKEAERNILSLALSEQCGTVFSQVEPSELTDAAIRSVYTQAMRFWQDTGTTDFGALILNGTAEEQKEAMDALNAYYSSMDANAHIVAFKNEASIERAKALGAKLMSADSFEVIEDISADLQKITRGTVKSEAVTYADLIDKFLTRKTTKLEAYETGFPRLDSHVVISPGDFVILAGEQSSGKTAFSLELMNRFAKRGYRCTYFSLETEAYKLGDRALTNYVGMNFARVKRQDLDGDDWERISEKMDEIKSLPGQIIPSAGKTVEWIKAEAIRQNAQIIFVDYLGLITPRRGTTDSVYRETSAISKELHTLAQTERITVIALQQQNRGKAGEADMHSLRDSSQIESDADVIMILTIPEGERDEEEYTPSWTEKLNIVKNKEGDKCFIPFTFDGSRQKFYEQVRIEE